jgi:uncharacterized protein YndB with AHSA1/START domain
MTTDRIERDVLIEAPVERVWELLTEAEHVGRWFGDAGAEIDLRPGGEILFRWREHGDARGRVEVVERPHRFAWSWAPFGPRGEGTEPEAPAPGNSTLVEFTLAAESGGTRLSVVESGFAALDGDAETVAANLAGNTRGWGMELDDLVAYAASATATR